MTTSKNSFTHPWKSKGYAIADLFPKSDSVFYRLPLAQRDYAWEAEQITDLLDPILILAEKWENTYSDLSSKGFTGAALDPQLLVEEDKIDYYTVGTATFSVVGVPNEVSERFSRSNPVLLDILDGQQRLTTITLLLLACWHLLDEYSGQLGDTEKAEDLASELKERLRVTDSSRSPAPRVFRHRDGEMADIGNFVVWVLASDYAKYTEHDLFDAFDTITWSLRTNCGLDSEQLDHPDRLDLDLLNLVDTILYGVRCGALVAPPGKTTETFIVINRSGVELTEMDIIKCHILDLCQQNSTQEKAAEKKFVKLYDDGHLDEVTRIWIDSRHDLDKPADKKKLATDFAALNLLGSKTKASDVLAELREASDVYWGLKNGLVEGKPNPALQMANSLKINSAYSVILASPDYCREKVADIISRAVSIRKICGGKLMGAYHASIYELCGGLADGSYLDTDGLLSFELFEAAVQEQILGEFTRGDFLQSVEHLNYMLGDHKKVMRVLFSNISNLLNRGFSTPVSFTDKYSLDHFHPQAPRKDDDNAANWKSEEDRLLLHSIGNIAPLPVELNNKLSNRPIRERFDSIVANAGDGIAVAKFCCSLSGELTKDFSTGITAFFRGNSRISNEVLQLLPALMFARDTWTPTMTKERTLAIAKLSLMLLDPSETLLSAKRRVIVENPNTQMLYMSSESRGYDAKMIATWEDDELTEFTLLQGSNIRLETVESAPVSLKEDRNRAIATGLFVEVGGCLVVNGPVTFETASAAAAMVAGSNMNGRKSWVDAKGVSLAELEEARQL